MTDAQLFLQGLDLPPLRQAEASNQNPPWYMLLRLMLMLIIIKTC